MQEDGYWDDRRQTMGDLSTPCQQPAARSQQLDSYTTTCISFSEYPVAARSNASVGELVGWLALVVALGLGAALASQIGRIGRLEKQYRALMKGAGPTALNMSLGELVANQAERLEATRTKIEGIQSTIHAMEGPVAHSIQCVGLVRFNPFQDTGGDQSFALALLDRKGDGVVVSSLHGRTSTRFYAKPVKGGVSHISLSEEEIQAIQQAMSKSGLRTED
jgi:hypothetical protein